MFDSSDEDERDSGARSDDESEYVDEEYTEPDEPDFGVEPEIPEAPSPENADRKLEIQFWGLVAVFNLALLGVSLGAMFAVFERDYTLGGQLFLGGAILLAYGFYRYRSVKATLGDDEGKSDGD